MNESHGSNTLNTLMILIVVAGLAALLIGACGTLPQGNGVTWDSTAEIQRNETARLRIVEEEATARLRIQQNADTQRTWALIIGAVAIIGTVGTVVVLITRAAAQRPVVVQAPPPRLLPPEPVRVIVAQLPGWDADIIDGQWVVANDREWMTIEDASRLLTMRSPQ